MILISCVDTALGMRFHNRRQSRDRELCGRVLELCGGELWLGAQRKMGMRRRSPAFPIRCSRKHGL